MTSTFHIRDGVVVNTTNGTVYDPHIDVQFGGLIRSTTNTGTCTFNHDFNNEGIAGHDGHTGTITITGTATGCGLWLGGYSGYEPVNCGGYAYVTQTGLNIVTHRLLSDLINGGHAEYSGKLAKARLWFDYDSDDEMDSYMDVPLVTGFADKTDDIIPYSFDTETDENTGVSYDVVNLDLKFIIPQYKEVYYGTTGTHDYRTTSTDIYKIEILTENGKIFATATITNNPFYTLSAYVRYEFEWRILLGNDLNPHEWSQFTRSAVTQFGLYLAGNRLLFDQNRSAMTTGPFGVQIQSYGTDKVLDSTLTGFKCYHYDDSGGTWGTLSTTVTLDDDDVLMVLAPNKFTSLYMDMTTAMGTGTVTASYYNGSSWETLNAIGDNTLEFTQSGYIEFHAPHDWESIDSSVHAILGSNEGYAIKFTVDVTATSPVISLDSSYLFYAGVDTTDSTPENILSVTTSDLSKPLLGKSERAIISASFTGSQIGHPLDTTGYIMSGNLNRIRGTALTSYDPLITVTQGPVYVATAYYSTYQGKTCVTFSDSTYPLKPDIVLMLRGLTDGKVIELRQNFDVINESSSWKIISDSIATGQNYELWYIPKYIDTSSWDLYKIHSMYGRERGYSRPADVSYGFVSSDVFGMTPQNIYAILGGGDPMTWKSSNPAFGNWAWLEEEQETHEKFSHLAIRKKGRSSAGSTSGRTHNTYAIRAVKKTIIDREWEEIRFPTDTESDKNKKVIKMASNSYVFSYSDNNNYMACIMTFPAPVNAGEFNLKLDLAFAQSTMQKTLGSDVYIYRQDAEGWSWQQIGSTTTQFGQDGIFYDRYDITSDAYLDQEVFYVLIISKFPQFTSAHGIIIPGDVPEEDLSKTYQEIYNQYNGDNTYSHSNLIQPINFLGNSHFYDVLYARVIGITNASNNNMSKYVQGIDYIYDEANDRIEILDNVDISTHNIGFGYPIRALDGYRHPSIGYQTDVFTNVGTVNPDSPGKFNDGNKIYINKDSDDFNFIFALSRTPYRGKGMVSALIEKETVETTNNIDIYWEPDYEYGTGEDYADNRIKDIDNGNGCYVAHVLGATLGKWHLNQTYACEKEVTITTTADNEVQLPKFPATDIPDENVTEDPDGHGSESGVVRLYNNDTTTDIWANITDVSEEGLITVSSGITNGHEVEVWYFVESNDYTPGTVSITYPYLMDNGYTVVYIEDFQNYVFSKTWFEHNTYHPSFQMSNKDVLTIGTQIDVDWPKGREPYLDLEDIS